MKLPYTSRQGQLLPFIHHYTTLHGRPPAEAEMVQFFRVTPPSVHQMILTLERRDLITRTPSMARSVRLKLPPEQLPLLREAITMATIRPPMCQIENQYDAGQGAAMLRLGKIQINDLFARAAQQALDDSDFIPLLETLVESFSRACLGAAQVKELRRYVCEVYHRCCQAAQPESTFEENMELMFSFLPGPARTHWQGST